MPENTFSYQILMDAMFDATDARGSVHPDNGNYIAISLDTVKSIVGSFESKPSSSEAENNHGQARRLWYRFKEYCPSCACGIVRLLSSVPNDPAGIVTGEDLLGMDIKTSKGVPSLDREMLKDDLSEIHSCPAFFQFSTVPPGAERPTRLEPPWRPKEPPGSSRKAEMTLIRASDKRNIQAKPRWQVWQGEVAHIEDQSFCNLVLANCSRAALSTLWSGY